MLNTYYDIRAGRDLGIKFQRTYRNIDLYTKDDDHWCYTSPFDCKSIEVLDNLIDRYQQALDNGNNPPPLVLTGASIIACFSTRAEQHWQAFIGKLNRGEHAELLNNLDIYHRLFLDANKDNT